MASEIVLSETEPETEWIRGRAVQKVSPQRDHARVQLELGALLNAWSSGRGEVATEWRFRIQPPGEERRPLVPDIAYVSNERLDGYSTEDLQAPPFAPSVAVEIVSPDDVRADIAAKVDVYLRSDCELVIVVDPKHRSVRLHDRAGVKDLRGDAMLAHSALPEFELRLDRFFSTALDRPIGPR